MNTSEIYNNIDTILNIDNKKCKNFSYKKGQKLYETHFFEDLYKPNNINTHYGIDILEEYEAYITIIGNYLIQTIKSNIYNEKEFDTAFFDNYLSKNFKANVYYGSRCYHETAKISNFWNYYNNKSEKLSEVVKNIGYTKEGMKYVLKYISGTEDALNGTIDITNFTVTESQYNEFDNVIKYSSNNNFTNIYTVSDTVLKIRHEYKLKKEQELYKKQNKSVFLKIIDFLTIFIN